MKIKKTFFLLLCFLTAFEAFSQPNYFGVNLAGADFGSTMPGKFNTDYTYPNSSELDYYQSKGLLLIRLPFKWERIQRTLGGPLDGAELNRIKEVVQEVTDRGMYCVLDVHNYGRYKINGTENVIGSTNVTIAHIKDLWTKLAKEFKDETNIWGYGIMNEPHDLLASTPWVKIAQEIINGIRSQDQNTTIVVGGDSWSSAQWWESSSGNLKTLIDPSNKLIFEAHCYFDKDASGQYRFSYDGENATPNTGVERVKPFVDWLNKNKLRGFLGEYSIPDNDPRWLITLDNFLNYLKNNGVNAAYWAGGPWWGKNFMTIEPFDGITDRPQMSIVEKYLLANDDATIDIESLKISGDAEITTDNGTLQLTATVSPEDAPPAYKWVLTNGTGMATISKTGLVTARRNGTVSIKAVSDDEFVVLDEITITISNQIVTLPEISILKNGDFILGENGLESWGVNGNGSVVDGWLTIECTPKIDIWDIMTYQGVKVDATTKYIVRFKAKASVNMVVPFIIEDTSHEFNKAVTSSSPWRGTNYWSIPITTKAAWYEFDVIHSSFVEGSTYQPSFQVGLLTGTLSVDSVFMYKEADLELLATSAKSLSANSMKVYPNPVGAEDELYVGLSASNVKVAIYNAIGQKLMEKVSSGNLAKFDVSSLVKGMYVVKLSDGTSHKFIR
ncbi:MAG TPA: cellulase family glycosylhydrolase [Prolixibacteraceae bacterium]|nr:cellulase family glycosylhydrolase [Prolixibacteraceae bacterium]